MNTRKTFGMYRSVWWTVNMLKPEQQDQHFADAIFICFFLRENFAFWFHWNSFLTEGLFDKTSSSVQLMVWCRTGDIFLWTRYFVDLYGERWNVVISIIYWHWGGTGSWNLYSLKTRNCLSYKVTPWPLLTWRHKEPGHQKPWCWPTSPEIFWLQQQKC